MAEEADGTLGAAEEEEEAAEAAGSDDEAGEELLAAHEAFAARRHACFDFDELDAMSTELWVDPDFPPTDASVCGTVGRGLQCYEGLQWLRPEQLDPVPELFSGGSPRGAAPAGAGNVIQGKLDDCYLVSAIALLTLDGPLLRHLFASYLPNEGRCCVRLFLYGRWKEVEVDTLLPCDRGEPAFARSRDGSEVYACLLEKAFAKVYGSFHALTGGNMGEALHDLTGTAVEDINLTRLGLDRLSSELWETLKEHHAAKNLIACGCTTASGDARAADAHAKGLLVDHAYSVVALAEPQLPSPPSCGLGCGGRRSGGVPPQPKLLKVVNPWGHFEWRGAWSSASEEWTAALRQELRYDGTDTGAFWMELSDFVKFFNRLHICRSGPLRAGNCARVRFDVETCLATAGGCTNFASFYKNVMFRVALAAHSTPREVSVTVSQPDARRDTRSTPGARMTYPQMGLTLLVQDFVPGVATDALCCTPNRYEVLQKTSFWNKRDVSMVFGICELAEGKEYRVVPSCFFPDDPAMGRFTLHFCWEGARDDLDVQRVGPAAKTAVVLEGKLSATHGEEIFGHQPCYRVVGPESVIPLSLVLVKAPGLLRQWCLADPLHAALRALFEAFDADANGRLDRQEMWSLLEALVENKPKAKASLHQDIKDAIFQEFDRTGSGAVTVGQFVAQSSALLAALRVPKAELRDHVESLARKLGRAAMLMTSVVASGQLAAGAAARGVYVAAVPLRCHPAEYEGPEASLAQGCGVRLPVLSTATVWSASFRVKQDEFFICPFTRGGSGPCAYELQVLSPLPGVSVEPSEQSPGAMGIAVAF